MGIFGWSLPPGCSTLPGEGADEQAAEAMMDAIYEILAAAKCDTSSNDCEEAAKAIYKMVGEAYSTGYKDGMSDESLAREWPVQEQG